MDENLKFFNKSKLINIISVFTQASYKPGELYKIRYELWTIRKETMGNNSTIADVVMCAPRWQYDIQIKEADL